MKCCRAPPLRRTWRPSLRRQRTDVVRRALLLKIALAPVLLLASMAVAQESSSAAHNNAATSVAKAPDAPTAALRDALFAACSQSEASFSKFPTARNAGTFSHPTPPLPVAHMKRFALL